MEYKIGQILTSNKDVEIEKALSGEKIIIPKGNKIIIGADKFAHHIKTGMIQPLQNESEIKGYDTEGIAEFLFMWLQTHLPIDEMLEDYDCTEENLKEELECALDEIGF